MSGPSEVTYWPLILFFQQFPTVLSSMSFLHFEVEQKFTSQFWEKLRAKQYLLDHPGALSISGCKQTLYFRELKEPIFWETRLANENYIFFERKTGRLVSGNSHYLISFGDTGSTIDKLLSFAVLKLKWSFCTLLLTSPPLNGDAIITTSRHLALRSPNSLWMESLSYFVSCAQGQKSSYNNLPLALYLI